MKSKLCILYFLQFGVWGCYLTSLGQFLGSSGLGSQIAWFYAAIGLVSLLTPTFFGYISDRFLSPNRVLGCCHFLAGLIMLSAFFYSLKTPQLDFGIFYTLYLLFLCFYMPTMALANTVTFGLLKAYGHNPVDSFPVIRVWGTIGFIAAMWFVNTTYWCDGTIGWTISENSIHAMSRFQYNAGQLCCSGILGIVTALFTLTIPKNSRNSKALKSEEKTFRSIFSNFLKTKQFFQLPSLKKFLIFAALAGVCLQISNGYVTPFITHFIGDSNFYGTFAAANATMLFSISQIAEAFFILTVGVSLKKIGIKYVFAVGLFTWALRFLLLGLGNPGSGLWMIVLSMIVYGVGFNFITIAGHLYIDSKSPEGFKGFGQGAMMLMSNGLGATLGTLCAGEIVNHWCHWDRIEMAPGITAQLFMGDWIFPWLIFAAYAFVIGIIWLFVKSKSPKVISD